ncbi:hypothetical protein D3C80_1493150 [compost metagenome]
MAHPYAVSIYSIVHSMIFPAPLVSAPSPQTMPAQVRRMARLPAKERLYAFTQRARCPRGEQCFLQCPACGPVQQAFSLETGEQVEGVHVRPQVCVKTCIVAIYQVVEGMRRVLEVGQWPVTTTLTGVTQALLE